jgi:hypothetical protein
MAKIAKRTRIVVDVTPTVRRRIRLAAALKDQTMRENVRQALSRQVELDLTTEIHAGDDPVLTDLWDNAADGVYDRR